MYIGLSCALGHMAICVNHSYFDGLAGIQVNIWQVWPGQCMMTVPGTYLWMDEWIIIHRLKELARILGKYARLANCSQLLKTVLKTKTLYHNLELSTIESSLILIRTFCMCFLTLKYHSVCHLLFVEIPCKIQHPDYKLKRQFYMLSHGQYSMTLEHFKCYYHQTTRRDKRGKKWNGKGVRLSPCCNILMTKNENALKS